MWNKSWFGFVLNANKFYFKKQISTYIIIHTIVNGFSGWLSPHFSNEQFFLRLS